MSYGSIFKETLRVVLCCAVIETGRRCIIRVTESALGV